jgi:hypothetical protein
VFPLRSKPKIRNVLPDDENEFRILNAKKKKGVEMVAVKMCL